MNKWNNFETLEHYKGIVWTSKSFKTEKRGNICFYKNDYFHLIGYVSPSEFIENGLDGVVVSKVNAMGLQYMLEEDVYITP